MRAYAKSIGAEYAQLRGPVFDARLTPPCQKLAMLDADLDEYDRVCMVDADVFPRAGLRANVFELHGIGIPHPEAFRRVHRNLPDLTNPAAPFWGGAIYLLDRDTRTRLREGYNYNEATWFNCRGNGEDEGIMHRLAHIAGYRTHPNLPSPPLYFGPMWARSSYEPDVADAFLIHIRHHDGKGNRVDKMDELRRLQRAGIIAS